MVRQYVELEAGVEYEIGMSVLQTSSSAFFALTDPNGTTSYPLDYLAPGDHSTTITPAVSGQWSIGLGVNNPNGSTAEFAWGSVKELNT
jgi:hypothetical protein